MDEKPCKHGPWAYRGDFQSGVRYCVGCGVDATTLVQAERARADRLAAALDGTTFVAHHMAQLSNGGTHEPGAWRDCGDTLCKQNRAALADSPQEFRPIAEAFAEVERRMEHGESWSQSADSPKEENDG